MSQSSLRGHSLKLNKKGVRRDVAIFSFSNRVVNEWHILDEEIISGCSLAGFKRKLDRHLRDKGDILATTLRGSRPVVQSASLIMTSLMTS